MFFNSVKEINRFRKETNRLLSKRMSKKVTVEKATYSKLRFYKLKSSSSSQFLGSSNSFRYHSFFLLQVKNQRSGSKTVCGFSIIFTLKGTMTDLKPNSRMFLVEQKRKRKA